MGGMQKHLTTGLQAGLSVVVYLVAGLFLDRWLGTSPWLMLLGILVGVGGMFALFFRMAKELDSPERNSENLEDP